MPRAVGNGSLHTTRSNTNMTLLSDNEQKQVATAISEVEQGTDAELVTVLAASSDDYAYIPLLWAGVLALLLPGSINLFT